MSEETTEEVVDDKVVTTEETGTTTDAEVIEKTLIDVDADAEETDAEKKVAEDAEEGETVEIKMPELGEGVELDYGLFEKMLPVLKGMSATQEQVDELANTYLGHVVEAAKAHGDKMISKYQEIKTEWKNETQKTLGNEIKQNLQFVGNALKQFGSPKLVELFNETGVGDNIEVVQCFAKIGKHFTEDNFVDGKTTIEGKTEDVLYPSMDK